MTPARSANSTSAPAETWASAACLAVAGSNKLLMKLTLTVTLALTDWAPAMKALTMRLTSGIGHPADDADDVRLGQATGEHAGEVGRLLDPVVEDGQVGVCSCSTGAEHEGDVREVGRDLAHGVLVAEGVTEDDGGLLVCAMSRRVRSMPPA